MLIHHTFPADGEYVFQIALLRGTSEELYGRVSKDEQLELSIDGKRIRVFDIDAEERDRKKVDNVTPPLEVRAPVTAGPHSVGATFVKKNYGAVEDVFSSTHLRSSISVLDVSRTVVPHVSSVMVGGPLRVTGISESASRHQIFSCRPVSGTNASAPRGSSQTNAAAETKCAEEIISTLTRRAFRRPSSPEDLEVLMDF